MNAEKIFYRHFFLGCFFLDCFFLEKRVGIRHALFVKRSIPHFKGIRVGDTAYICLKMLLKQRPFDLDKQIKEKIFGTDMEKFENRRKIEKV